MINSIIVIFVVCIIVINFSILINKFSNKRIFTNYKKEVYSNEINYICENPEQYYECINDIIQDFMTQEFEEIRYIRLNNSVFIVKMDESDLSVTQFIPKLKIRRRVLHVQKPLF